MIDDIVLLPRRLSQFKQDAEVTSELVCCPPISSISRSVGYNSPDDSTFLMFGNYFEVPTWKDAWFRFKMVENTILGTIEYFCVSESPIQLLNIKKSAATTIYCLWVAVTDMMTHKQRKFALWKNIRALAQRSGPTHTDIPIEAAIADEIRQFAWTDGNAELLEKVSGYPTAEEQVPISEIGARNGVHTYLTIYSNIKALEDIYSYDGSIHAPDGLEVFRGADFPDGWTNLNVLKRCSLINYVLNGPVILREILFLFSSRFALHCYQRGFSMSPLPDDTEVSLTDSENPELFSIIEYIETIPYGEFELTVRADGGFTFVNYHPFSLGVTKRIVGNDQSTTEEPEVVHAASDIHELIANRIIQVTIARSWAEEAYITLMYVDGSTRRFYLDLAVYGLCSRCLLRDYPNSPLGWGL